MVWETLIHVKLHGVSGRRPKYTAPSLRSVFRANGRNVSDQLSPAEDAAAQSGLWYAVRSRPGSGKWASLPCTVFLGQKTSATVTFKKWNT